MATLNYETPANARLIDRPWFSYVLLLLGVQLWFVLGRGMYGNTIQWRTALIAIVIVSSSPLTRWIRAGVEKLDRAGNTTHILLAIFIWVAGCFILYHQAVSQDRYFYPKAHDEFAYLIQMQMLTRGHLWYPMHPLGDFFDSFQMIIDPVYCPMYFPGQALLYTPSIWLHLPPWVLPLIASGACAMMMYLVFTRLFDRTSGVMAAVMLISAGEFRRISIELFAHLPSLLLGLLMVWAYLRWRDSEKKWRWALLLGILAGWSGITRPLDGLMYAIPIGIAMLAQLRQPRSWAGAILPLMLGALPFLCVQAIFDRAVSGSLSTTPFHIYAERDFPMTSFGFHDFDPGKRPQSILPQKHAYHDDITIKLVQEHTVAGATHRLASAMLPQSITYNLPQELLIVLLPVGVLALLDRRRIVLFSIWPLFLAFYFFYTFYLSRYVVPVVPAIIMLVIGSIPFLPRIRVQIIAFILAICITSLPSINHSITDELFQPSELIDIQRKLDAIPGKAIVLFRWDKSANHQAEPVYNSDVAWPDDARVIRAHDLGERNSELYHYYASRAPDRIVYRLDRKDNSLSELGTVKDLASR